MTPSPLWIDGEWITTPESRDVLNPYTGKPIGAVCFGESALVEKALAVAIRAFEITRALPAFERADLLHRVAAGIESRRAEFRETIIAESGKPYTYADSEITRAISAFTAAAEEARHQPGELLDIDAFSSGKGHTGFLRRFPLGVLYGMTPFNFPLNLVAHKVAPVLATGNVMILKPAIKTPLTALLLGKVLEAAGTPRGQIQILTFPHEAGEKLLADDRVKMISFTGSPEVGWPLKNRCGMKKVCLELGGNAAVIVHHDADWKSTLKPIALGGFGYAGQSCISVQRILVQASIYTEFRNAFIEHVRSEVAHGDPTHPKTVIGPMIDTKALTRITDWIQSAIAAGGNLLLGGKPEGTVLPPTILENVPLSEHLYSEEAFAPVVVLQSYQTFEEALTLVNGSAYGLQAGVYTQNIKNAWMAFQQLEVGGVLINQVPTFRVETMPYGGAKASGFGREGIRYAMEEMTEPRALIWNLNP